MPDFQLSTRIAAKLAAIQRQAQPEAIPEFASPTRLVSTPLKPRKRTMPREQQVAAGKARMAKLSPEEKRASAQKAVRARWDRVRAAARASGWKG